MTDDAPEGQCSPFHSARVAVAQSTTTTSSHPNRLPHLPLPFSPHFTLPQFQSALLSLLSLFLASPIILPSIAASTLTLVLNSKIPITYPCRDFVPLFDGYSGSSVFLSQSAECNCVDYYCPCPPGSIISLHAWGQYFRFQSLLQLPVWYYSMICVFEFITISHPVCLVKTSAANLRYNKQSKEYNSLFSLFSSIRFSFVYLGYSGFVLEIRCVRGRHSVKRNHGLKLKEQRLFWMLY
nr:uncharacterized protein LOC113707186 isoform X2 [Coffea arabica]